MSVFCWQLWGVNGIMGGVYGPVSFPGSGHGERSEQRVHMVRGNGPQASQSHESLISSLGPEAAHELRSRSTRAALKAYRFAPRDDGVRGRPRPVAHAKAKEQDYADKWGNTWHPGRFSDRQGSGETLLRSHATQRAIREMRAHGSVSRKAAAAQPAAARPATAEMDSKGEETLLATALRGHAGFSNVHSRRQALEAIKDLLEEQVKHKGPSPARGSSREQELSSVRAARRSRAQREHVTHSAVGHALSESRRLGEIHTAVQMGREDVRSQKDMQHARREEAADMQRRALTVEREEMAEVLPRVGCSGCTVPRWVVASARWSLELSLLQNFERNVTRFAPHPALKIIA